MLILPVVKIVIKGRRWKVKITGFRKYNLKSCLIEFYNNCQKWKVQYLQKIQFQNLLL